jgi:hypothetical protein
MPSLADKAVRNFEHSIDVRFNIDTFLSSIVYIYSSVPAPEKRLKQRAAVCAWRKHQEMVQNHTNYARWRELCLQNDELTFNYWDAVQERIT